MPLTPPLVKLLSLSSVRSVFLRDYHRCLQSTGGRAPSRAFVHARQHCDAWARANRFHDGDLLLCQAVGRIAGPHVIGQAQWWKLALRQILHALFTNGLRTAACFEERRETVPLLALALRGPGP